MNTWADPTMTYRVGKIKVFPDRLEIHISGERVKLEPKVMALLTYFSHRAGQVLAKEQILADVWAGTNVVDEALHRAVSILRKKLEDNPDHPVYIETISKKGYRFLLPAEPFKPRPEDEMKLTERSIKVSPLLLILAVVAGAAIFFLGWKAFFNEQPIAPKAESPPESQIEETSPSPPEPDGSGNEEG